MCSLSLSLFPVTLNTLALSLQLLLIPWLKPILLHGYNALLLLKKDLKSN